MKKKFVITLFIFSLLLITYTITWYLFLFTSANQVNKQFGSKYISTKLLSNTEEYYIRFTKIVPYGFPFKIGFKIIGWTEESKVGKIECLEPVYLGYDLIEQNIFGRYAGEALAWHKPLESKFGSKIINEDYLFTIGLPLSFKVLQIMFSDPANGFELVNFIKNAGLKSKKAQIFDLVSNEKLYDQDYKLLEASFDKRKYYTSLEDFLNNIPYQVQLDQNSKVNESTFTKRVLPPNILFGLNWPFSFSGVNKITVKINTPNIKDFSKDLEVHYKAIESVSNIHSASGELIYKGKINNKDADIYLKADISGEIKKGFFDKVFNSLGYFTNYIQYGNRNNLIKEGKPIEWLLSNLTGRLDNLGLRELENHHYQLNIDLNLNNDSKETKTMIHDFSLFSKNTGMVLRSENILKHDLNWSVKGEMGIHNQQVLLGFLFNKDIFGIFRNYHQATRELYAKVIGQFLKSISEYPNSSTNDITLDYSFGSKELKNGKLGKVDANNLKSLFDLALYKEAVKTIGSSELKTEKIQELVPSLDIEKQRILEKLMINSTAVGQDMWNELIK